MFAKLSPEQTNKLQNMVCGKLVLDIGAGDMGLARLLASWGAYVTAIEKEPYTHKGPPMRGHVAILNEYIKDTVVEPHDIAVVSWPVTHQLVGIEALLSQARTVVYIGCNDGGTSCGDPNFWRYLLTRKYLRGIASRKNDMIVYGEKVPTRVPEGLEHCAWNPEMGMAGVANINLALIESALRAHNL